MLIIYGSFEKLIDSTTQCLIEINKYTEGEFV